MLILSLYFKVFVCYSFIHFLINHLQFFVGQGWLYILKLNIVTIMVMQLLLDCTTKANFFSISTILSKR